MDDVSVVPVTPSHPPADAAADPPADSPTAPPGDPRGAIDPVSGLQLRVPAGWTARLGGPESARRLVLEAGGDAPSAPGARIVAVCIPSDEDVRIAAPAAATVLVTAQSGRVLDYTTWGGLSGRRILFSTDRSGEGPGLGRIWLTARHGMLTTITLLCPAGSWAAASAAADVAISGLRLPAQPSSRPLGSSTIPAKLDPHLARLGEDLEDLTTLDAAQPRPLLGRHVDVHTLDLLLHHPDGPPGTDEQPSLTAAAQLADLGLFGADGRGPTPRGLRAAHLLQTPGPAARVDVHEPHGTATAFLRVDGDDLLVVTSEVFDPERTEGPGVREARSLRLALLPAGSLAAVLAGQVRLGPAWTLPSDPVTLDAGLLARRWADPDVPPPPGDPHLAAWWGEPWSLVTLRWTTSGGAGDAAGTTEVAGPDDDHTDDADDADDHTDQAGEGYEHGLRLLRAGARGWVRLTPTTGAEVVADVVPTAAVFGHLLDVARALTSP